MRSTAELRREAIVAIVLGLAGCGGSASPTRTGAAGGGAAGSAGVGGGAAGAAGQSAGGAGGSSGSGGVGQAGAGGATGAAGSTAGAAGSTAGAGGAAGATAGAGGVAGATAGVGGTVTSGTAGGVFVACDDHADFNGRGLCSPTGKFGAVVATQTLTATGTLTTLTAAFAAAKPATDPGCTQEAAGADCAAVTCPRGGTMNPAGPEAGAVTAKSNGGSLVTKPDATGAYDVAGLAAALWSMPKAALTFTAAGGAIPAFSETFCGPPAAVITKPAAAPGAGLVIDRSADLAVQWTGGAVGELEVALRDDSAAGGSIEVRCFFTGASAQGVVPKAALAKLSAGTHAVSSSIWVRKISLPAGTCVELTGVATSVSAVGGAPWNGDATFQ